MRWSLLDTKKKGNNQLLQEISEQLQAAGISIISSRKPSEVSYYSRVFSQSKGKLIVN